MKFRATIRKEGAADETRVIDAESRFALYEQVQREGGFVTKLEDLSSGLPMPAWLNLTIGSVVKRSEIMRMTKNLGAMIAAGLSVSRALAVIERQSSNKRLKKVASGLADSVRRGSSFHDALAEYPNVFPELLIAMTKAGEESGSLADALNVVSLQMERSEELARKIRGAMIYPAIVVTAIIIVAVLMLIYVVPTLTKTFKDLGVEVPTATRIIVSMSDFMVAHTVLVVGGLAALIAAAAVFVRSDQGSTLVLKVALRLPVIGEIVRETYAARAARTLSSLLASGVPILNGLAITKEVVHARPFARVIDDASLAVKKGEPLSASFAVAGSPYPLQMSDMLAVGEETGKVAEMLQQIATFYEQDVADKTKDLSTIIEPVLMLLIGAVVGVFAVSMIAPIYSLSSAIG